MSEHEVDMQAVRNALREDRERARYYRALRGHAASVINALNRAKKEIDSKPENYDTGSPDFLSDLVVCLTAAHDIMQTVEDFYVKECGGTVKAPNTTRP